MKYKVISCAVVVLLMATPSFAQKMSPIIVETGKPVPSIVRSGEPFKITYRVRYMDIVLIIEEQMRFGDLLLTEDKNGDGSKAQISTEVIDLSIGENHRIGSEDEGFFNVQDFTYTFRVINERKGSYKVPSFDFIWVEKRAGVTADKAQDQGELKKFATDEVGFTYVSSIVKPPPLDIRDETRFEGFAGLADRLTYFAYTIISLCGLWILVVVVKFFRAPKVQKVADKDPAKVPDDQPQELLVTLTLRTRKEVIRELRKLLRSLSPLAMPSYTERMIFILLRGFVVAELSKEPIRALVSDTPNEIHSRLANLDGKQIKIMGERRHSVFLALSAKLMSYYEDIESDSTTPANFFEPKVEIQNLIDLINNLSRTGRCLNKLDLYMKFLRQYLGAD